MVFIKQDYVIKDDDIITHAQEIMGKGFFNSRI
jgi:hypothetical protein